MKLEYNGKIIEYEIDKGNRKNIYISIRDEKVIVKGPKKMTDDRAIEIAESKKKWIFKKLEDALKSNRKIKEEKYMQNEKFYREEAEKRISQIMEKMINITGLRPEKYKLMNFKRAWGNCSNKKVIKLNAKLVMYSDFAIEYVCLHELCHLKYMNHSKKFWNLVEMYMPDYKIAENELK